MLDDSCSYDIVGRSSPNLCSEPVGVWHGFSLGEAKTAVQGNKRTTKFWNGRFGDLLG